jgi:hypothetical protein
MHSWRLPSAAPCRLCLNRREVFCPSNERIDSRDVSESRVRVTADPRPRITGKGQTLAQFATPSKQVDGEPDSGLGERHYSVGEPFLLHSNVSCSTLDPTCRDDEGAFPERGRHQAYSGGCIELDGPSRNWYLFDKVEGRKVGPLPH